MFTEMSLKNFKAWRDTDRIRLAPITVFFGANSSGKTSLLQSILLLKQTAESTDRTRVLHPGDERSLVDLGTVSNFVHRHGADTLIEFCLRWILPEPIMLLRESGTTEIQFTLAVIQGPEGQPLVSQMQYHFDSAHVGMTRNADGSYDRTGTVKSLKRHKGPPLPLPAPIRFYGFPDEFANYYEKTAWLADLAFALEKQLGRVHYVGPLREYPKRLYLWAGERPPNVGVRGELTVPAILAARSENLEVQRRRGERRRFSRFERVIAKWLRQMDIIESLRVETVTKQRREYELRVKRTASAAEVFMRDIGFGVSQVLPVLVQSYYAKADASLNCIQKCVEALTEIMADKQALVIDNDWRILREYMNKLSQSGQPGVGDRFLKWVLTNQANPSRCVQVTLTPRAEDKDQFEEFPDDPDLTSFDRADRKFVAVACAHLERPPILQALDTKWWGWKEALQQVGVTVTFLCQDEIQMRYEQKFGQRRGRKRRPTRGR